MTTTRAHPTRGHLDEAPDVDLVDPDPASTPALDATLARLQERHPVFWHGPKSRPGFWAVVGYADAVRVYRDAATFSAEHGMTIDSLAPDRDPASGMMVEVTDPPGHRRLRRSIGAFFADGVVSELKPVVDAYVQELVAEVRRGSGGPVEAVEAVAARIPTYTAGLLLGLPAADLPWITARTAAVFLSGTDTATGADRRAAAEHANGELLGYFAKLLRTARGRGTGTLVERLALGSGERDALTTGEAVLNALNLAVGGTTTTRSVLTNLLHGLTGHPEVLPALRAEPALVPTAVEEVVRWANPVRHLARVATRDVELGGRAIRAGDPVLVWARCANRDPAVFARPTELDVRRRPNPHIGFAAGPHSCPGTALARVQLRSLVTHLTAAFDRCEAAGPAAPMPSNFLHGYVRLPIRFVPAACPPFA